MKVRKAVRYLHDLPKRGTNFVDFGIALRDPPAAEGIAMHVAAPRLLSRVIDSLHKLSTSLLI